MSSGELVQKLMGRLSEARFCLEQGLQEGTADILKEVLAGIEKEGFPQSAREEIRSRAESMLESLKDEGIANQDPIEQCQSLDPVQYYDYGLALMDGQFWEEAIQELSMAAGLGFERLKSWEYCGDCASRLEKWEDAFRFYEHVYTDESLTDEQRNAILTKITKCSQAQKKKDARSATPVIEPEKSASADQPARCDCVNPSILSPGANSIDSIIGRTAASCESPSTGPLAGRIHYYRVSDLLHVGSSSLIFELEEQENGKKYAGQNLSGRFAEVLSPGKLAIWAKQHMMFSSRRHVGVFDLASIDGCFFIVREHLPLSLSDLLQANGSMPISLAVRLAYQVLEALGDLHLHMTREGAVQNRFHLDMRPSRVLARRDKPFVKIYNGGLWHEVEKTCPGKANLKELPLAHLAYRAPEQFRPYLARKRPPIFTDIYLFGTLLYEMLTGTTAFKASSFGEYEIQHCEQYPSPPKVWRPEIPETLNELIMTCLASDPMKRFRSTTQISLILEKAFPAEVARPKDDAYREYLKKLDLI
jgi:serine/threonine protein kinase